LLSEREYSQTQRFPGAKEKLALVLPGMEQPIFMSIDGARQFLAKSANIDLVELKKYIIIGTIAELHPNKGLEYLIGAMEQVCKDHPNILCIIMGDGEDKSYLSALISEHKLENNIKLLGYVPEAVHYLKALNIFLLPSRKEGLPYVLLEAGFASLPVIATTVGGIPEIIEDMKSGVLVQPKNSRELAHSISFMIEHPQMRRQYGTALRESVMQKFSLEKMVAGTEALYDNFSKK
jgi:glycosyltransferase involved in cell wall biosynthesis